MTRRPGPPPRSIVLPMDASGGWWQAFCGVIAYGIVLYALVSGLIARNPALIMGGAGSGLGVVVYVLLTVRRWLLWIALDGDRLVWRYALQDQRTAPVTEVATLDRSFGEGGGHHHRAGRHSAAQRQHPRLPTRLADAIVRVNPDAQILYTSKAW